MESNKGFFRGSFKRVVSFWMMTNPGPVNMVIPELTYKKWWLDFQGYTDEKNWEFESSKIGMSII